MDSDGHVYLLDKLKKKALLGDKYQKEIVATQLREERVEGSDLVRLGRSQPGRGKL